MNFGVGLNIGIGGEPDSVVIAPAAPTATAATLVTDVSFTANWNVATGATDYRFDLSTNSGFSSFVTIGETSYNNLLVSGGTTNSLAISGLTAGTPYYYRVRAVNAGGTSASSDPVISVETYQADTQAYIAACPDAMSVERKDAINTLIKALKASKNGSNQSIWDLTDKLGILANVSINNAAVNAKYPTLTTEELGKLQYVNSNPTMYQTNKGLVRNNIGNNHIYTRYKPNGTNNYKQGSSTIAIWVLQAETEAYKTNMATSIAASGNVCLRAQRNPGLNIVTASVNSATFDHTHTMTPQIGFFGAVRTASNKISIFTNTAKLTDETVNSDALPNSIIALSGVYGYETLYSTKALSFYFIGGALTITNGGQMEALRSAMSAYLSTMGVI